MDERNGQSWKSNERASWVEEQVWDHLLAKFDEYLLKDMLEWCHVFRIEKEKKKMILDKINGKITVRLKKNIIYSLQLFADLGLSY